MGFTVTNYDAYYVYGCDKNEHPLRPQKHKSVRLRDGVRVIDYCLTCKGVDIRAEGGSNWRSYRKPPPFIRDALILARLQGERFDAR